MIKHKRDAVTLGDVKNIHFNTMKRPSKDDSKAQGRNDDSDGCHRKIEDEGERMSTGRREAGYSYLEGVRRV